MRLIASAYQFLFGFKTYNRGVLIHLSLLGIYTVLFIAGHYFIDTFNFEESIRNYYQVKLSRLLVLTMVAQLLLLIFFRKEQFKALAREYLLEKGSAYNLAVFRVLFFISLAFHLFFYTLTIQIAWTYLPDSSRVGLPFMDWYIFNLPISPGLFAFASITAGILSVLVCIGLFTRYVMPVLVLLLFYIIGIPLFYGKFSHDHIFLWVPLLLCFAPMSDVWSIDALIKRKKNNSQEFHFKYLIHFKLIWLMLAIIYCFAGIIKLWDCSLDWALSDSMVNQMRWEWIEHYDKVPSFRLDNYPVLARLSGLGVIYFELLYFLLILKPKGRIWAYLGGFSLHKLCGYFMYIDFIWLRHVALSYINWHAFVSFIRKKKNTTSEKSDALNKENLWHTLQKHGMTLPIVIASVLLSFNFVFSAFGIHTYPFSSFATYSGIVPDKITLLKMDAFDKNGNVVDVKLLGKKANYRWESIRVYEKRIAEAFEKKDSLAVKIKMEEYWLLWRNNVPGLENVTRVDMYLQTTPIAPEERNTVLHSDSLGRIYPESLESKMKLKFH